MAPNSARPPLTHFLAIPLTTKSSAAQLSASLARFVSESTLPAPSPPSLTPPTATQFSPSDSDPLDLLIPPAAAATAAAPPSPSSNSNSAPPDAAPSTPRDDRLRIVPPRAFRPPSTLHLTLGMMSLRDASRVADAIAFLRALDLGKLLWEAGKAAAAGCDEGEGKGGGDAEVGSPGGSGVEGQDGEPSSPPLTVQLRGLHAMSAPHNTSVLYAEPEDSSGRLRAFCEAIRGRFQAEELVVREVRGLKLHATVVNMIYVKETGRGRGGGRAGGKGGGNRGAAETAANAKEDDKEEGAVRDGPGKGKIDARALIEKWKGELWAEVQLDRVAICEMGAKTGADGVVRYKEVASVAI